mmetsp:Transcript_15204/g.31903  ORF Transcript_15204/g.31903 Transcript_15204/m.31903 type:complete len:112 (+) Transcript_15204:1073-1408(+)
MSSTAIGFEAIDGVFVARAWVEGSEGTVVGEEVGICVGALVGAFVGSFVGCAVWRMQKLYPAGSSYKASQHSSIEQYVVKLVGGDSPLRQLMLSIHHNINDGHDTIGDTDG